MARQKTITTGVSEETWQAVKDIANLWGESISKATDRLVQRGLISIEKELGSKTPAYVKLARIEEELKILESREQRLLGSHERAAKLGIYDKVKEIQTLAKEFGIEIAELPEE